MEKNILIIGLNSELAQNVINELKVNNWNIYATSRQVGLMDKAVHEFNLDVCDELSFLNLKEKLNNLNFDVIINFAGIAIASAVEELNELDLKKQLDVNLFGLLRILKYLTPFLSKDGRFINISSMASYGIFPFLSPYCISKAAADILLNLFSVESNIKTVSIRPGATATKFWETSLEINKKTLEENTKKFTQEKEFLVKNAQRNTLHATNPIYIAKKIAQIIELKNPKSIYNVGIDSKFAKLTRFISQDITNSIIKFVLKTRIKRKK
ncbi:MAG: SDR family NAD(P)-dependent oxidoreductase [Candidatus Gastranaerophilales bacterium]|nr:SDR family NAD(P)-dependent oxidoreductase [Candidatus Gastranaerophilales bacterium]